MDLRYMRNTYRIHMRQLKENVPTTIKTGQGGCFYPGAAFQTIEDYVWELETALMHFVALPVQEEKDGN